MERVLGTTLLRRNSQLGSRLRLTGENSYDIPLKQSLEQLLSNENLFLEVMPLRAVVPVVCYVMHAGYAEPSTY